MSEQLEFLWSLPTPASAEVQSTSIVEVPRLELLHALIAERLKRPFTITITENRQTMMSLRPQRNGSMNVRLHKFFLNAPDNVLNAVANWVKHPRDKAAGAVVDAYIRTNAPLRDQLPVPTDTLQTQGKVHDLLPLYHAVNRAHFDNAIACGITWGRAPHRHRRRYMRLGSYAPLENLIRIHPHLDEEFVPEFFVQYIIFHEMLHAHLGIGESASGRRSIHPPSFRLLEQAYPDFDRAEAWLKHPQNLSRVMRARRV